MRRLFLLIAAAAWSVSFFGQNLQSPKPPNPASYIEHGRYREAIPLLLATVESSATSPHQRAMAQALLGLAYQETGDFERARTFYEQALAALATEDENSTDYAGALNLLAGLDVAKGDLWGAKHLLVRATKIYEQRGDHVGCASADLHLVGVAIQGRDLREAHKYLAKAKEAAGIDQPGNPELLEDLAGSEGWLAMLDHRPADALRYYTQAQDLCTLHHGPAHPLTGWTTMLVGKANAANGDLSLGLENMSRGLKIIEDAEGQQSARYLAGQLAYSSLLKEAGRDTEAREINSEAQRSLAGLRREPCASCTVSLWGLQQHQ